MHQAEAAGGPKTGQSPAGSCLPEEDATTGRGRLLDNIVHFGRALRLAGLKVGPGQVSEAVRAIETVGTGSREDFYWTLHACFVGKNEHRQVFSQVFRLFWRDPRYHEHMMAMLLPMVRGVDQERKAAAAARRAADALLGSNRKVVDDTESCGEEAEILINASGTSSARERLGSLDFEQMTNEEMEEAQRIIAGFSLPVEPLRSRRKTEALRGRHPDWRATMRQAARQGGEVRSVLRRRDLTKWPNLVAICDISGSMSVYSRTLLRFLHAVSGRRGDGWSRVFAFTFGTELTNITRQLRVSDADSALAAAGIQAQDWDGGTQIGNCLRTFNRDWSRRVFGAGAIVLLISDGLDSGCTELLNREIKRLRLSARRLIWINPLLRWKNFTPKAAGVFAMLPNVDCFRSGHSINSLERLAETISCSNDDGEKLRLLASMQQRGT